MFYFECKGNTYFRIQKHNEVQKSVNPQHPYDNTQPHSIDIFSKLA